MKLNYDPTTDTLHISFRKRAEVEGFDLYDEIVVHLDAEETLASIEIENASERVDLGAVGGLWSSLTRQSGLWGDRGHA